MKPITGRMYEVAIHANPEKFLDWDRPLREQRHIFEMAAESVGGERAARQAWKDWDDLNDHLAKIDYNEEHPLWQKYNQLSAPGPDRARIKLGGLYAALDKEAANPEKYPAARQLTKKGEDLYRAVAQRDKTNALGSQALQERGVPGVKYFDAMSRGAGEGTSNYVVFPTSEDIVQINKKYAKGGRTKEERRALMIARDHQNLLRRIANIYPGPGGGMDPGPNGGGYAGPGGGKYIGPSRYADGGNVPPFKLHSGAAELIEKKGQPKATPQQYAAMPGIKPDELKHSGFSALGTKAIPREQAAQHLRENAVPLKETVLGGDETELLKDLMIDERDRYEQRFEDRVGRPPRSDSELLAEMPSLADQDELSERGGTKYSDYQLPGGKNYREVLLHLDFDKEAQAKKAAGRAWDIMTPEQRQEFMSYPMRGGEGTDLYKSSHWDQPNVLAHIRMSDRKGPNGEKVLHVEELQSDWGQQGREKGFKTGATQRYEDWHSDALKRARDKLALENIPEGTQKILMEVFGTRDRGHDDLARYLDEKPHADRLWQERLDDEAGIPSGPYVDNTQKWTDLALKRVLHEAAHGGYDKVVFTPGGEQNKRYKLSNQVRSLHYYPFDDGTGNLQFIDHRGTRHSQNDIKTEELPKYVGKEVAEKLLATERTRRDRAPSNEMLGHHLENLKDVEVGGEGMRGYYDNIMPKRLQALAQQHDPQAKVQLHGYAMGKSKYPGWVPQELHEQQVERGKGDTTDLHSLDVTPQMRESIKANGFNQFKRGGDVKAPAIKKTLDLRTAQTFPALATRYPKTAPPEWAFDPKKKTDYLAKRLSPEALAVQEAKKIIQKDIDEGKYKPFFDPLKRYDAASSEFGVKAPTTGIKKVKPETQAKYEAHARSKEASARLKGAFERGMLQARDASDWYLMGQLHNEYVAKYGPKLGSQLFKERFADAMAATTGGADPTANFLTSHYGNYVKANKGELPEKSYDLPFPIGGRYIAGNIDQFNKMIMQGKGVTAANPKRYNFAHNFLGDPTGATIDEQMSGLYDPKMSVPPEGTYGHYEGALADLAKKTKGAKSPRHFQEVAWAGAKDLGTKGGYRASPMISHVNESIERTSRLTGLPPDEVVAQNLVGVKGPMFNKGGAVARALKIARKVNGR